MTEGRKVKGKRERETTHPPDSDQPRLLDQLANLQREIAAQNAEISNLRELKRIYLNSIFAKFGNYQPMKVLWHSLTDEAAPGIAIPMAIIKDPRCGIERKVGKDEIIIQDVNAFEFQGETPLLLAIRAERNDVVEALLTSGADHSAANDYGRTALMVACIERKLTAIELLVRYGADLSATDDMDDSVAHWASFRGHDDVVRAIAAHGANLDEVGEEAQTPLYRASSVGNAFEVFLSHGVDLNVLDRLGRTPLYSAAEDGNVGAVEALVREGASLTAVDNFGCTPLKHYLDIWEDPRATRQPPSTALKARITALLTPKSML